MGQRRGPLGASVDLGALPGAHLPAADKAWAALVRDEQMLVEAATLRCDPFCVDLPTPEVAR